MSARIIDLAEARRLREIPAEVDMLQQASDSRERFHFWRGASGQRYVHTVYSLIDCPALPASNFVLVRRDKTGRRHVLAIGRLANPAGTLNLAEIRQRGAELGANEVHVHLLAGSAKQSRLVEFDLKTGQADAGPTASRALH
ncbi:MAG: hypothetical protein ACT4N2_12595 [Hyphomicrobium sp.]